MRIHLLDPGLRALRGHHFDLDARLAKALVRRGHEVLVCGASTARPELAERLVGMGIAFLPVFRRPPYFSVKSRRSLRVRLGAWIAGCRRAPSDGVSPELYRQVVSDTAEDLQQLPSAEAWFWPTLSAYQVAAACSAGHVPQIGGAWWLPSFPHQAGAAVWAESARRICREGLPIQVGFYDEDLCRRGVSLSDRLALQCLPVPHDGADGVRERNAVRRIGFFGHQRPARGRDLVRELVPILVSKGFDVVVQDSGDGGGYGGQATVLSFIDDFAAELARCDAVIWPSRAEAYAGNMSGVVSECIASGIPVIMPSGCLPADMAARFACVHYFHEYSSTSVMQALECMAGDFQATLARCQLARSRWHSVNGTVRLAQRVEVLAGEMV